MADKHRIFTISVARVYPFYLAKAEKKGRSKAEVDSIICWLTGYSQRQLDAHLEKETDFETFFNQAPHPNPLRLSIKGTICGIRVEEIQDPLMREIRCLDKLVDELAKGKPMEKILAPAGSRGPKATIEEKEERAAAAGGAARVNGLRTTAIEGP